MQVATLLWRWQPGSWGIGRGGCTSDAGRRRPVSTDLGRQHVSRGEDNDQPRGRKPGASSVVSAYRRHAISPLHIVGDSEMIICQQLGMEGAEGATPGATLLALPTLDGWDQDPLVAAPPAQTQQYWWTG
jgi:hypothetical protein